MAGRTKEERDQDRELRELRRTRTARVERMLHDDMLKQAPGNAIYWVAVVAGSFALNLLLLMAIAR
jgi:hypothetical protein